MQTQTNIAQTKLRLRENARTRSIDTNASDLEEISYDIVQQKVFAEDKKLKDFWKGIQRGIDATTAISGQQAVPAAKQPNHDKSTPSHPYIIHPEHPLKMLWDMLVSFLIVFSVILIPYNIGFLITPDPQEISFDDFIITCFAIDICLSFNTGYLDAETEKYVFRHKSIARRYLRGWFWVDLISTIPFDSICAALVTGHALKLIRLIRILRLSRLSKLYRIVLSSKSAFMGSVRSWISPSLISLLVLLTQIFIIAHILACFWHYIAVSPIADGFANTWVDQFSYNTQNTTERYVASLYYIIVTMLTVGYGDIRATNEPERVYAIMTMLVGGVVFGALISQITALIDKRNPQAKAFKSKMDDFNTFLVTTGLPVPTQRRAKLAYSYYLTKKSAFSESFILNDLSPVLLNELVLEFYRDDIQASHFLAGELASNPNFVVSCIMHCRPFEIERGAIILAEGDICNDMYFLKHGTVSVEPYTLPKRQAEVEDSAPTATSTCGYITEGNFFGDAEMYKNTTALVTYRATSHCFLYAISHKVIKEALQANGHMVAQFDCTVAHRFSNLMQVIHQPPTRWKPKGSFSSRFSFAMRSSFTGPSVAEDMHDADIWMDGDIMKGHEVNINVDPNKHLIRVYDMVDDAMVTHEQPLQLLRDRHLLHPNGKWKMMWDVFIGLWIVYSVLIVPVEIAFNAYAYNGSATVDLFITCLFGIDIILSFFTAYVSEERDALVIYQPLITKNYLSTWFAVDFFSTVPFDQICSLFAGSGTNLTFTKLLKILRLGRLLKMARMLKLGSYLERIEQYLSMPPAVFKLFSLLFQVFFIAHLIACLWWGLAACFPEITSTPYIAPWFKQVDMFNEPIDGKHLAARYLVSIYYSFTTVTTVGYGDIYPQSAYERGLAICIVLVGASMFGYTLANVSAALNNVNGSDSDSKERLTEVMEYLNEKSCSPALASRVIGHFQRKYEEQSYDLSHIASTLPPRLSTQILYSVHSKVMSNIPIFKFIHKKSVAVYLFQYFQHSFFDVGDYIVREKQAVEGLHFLVTGEAIAFKTLTVRQQSVKAAPKKAKRGSVLQLLTTAVNLVKTTPVDDDNESTVSANEPRKLADLFKATDTDPLFANATKAVKEMRADDFNGIGLDLIGPLVAGEFIGHTDMLQATVHSCHVKATSPTVVYTLSMNEMNKLIRLEPTVGTQLQSALVQAIRVQADAINKKYRRNERGVFLQDMKDKFSKSKSMKPTSSSNSLNDLMAASQNPLHTGNPVDSSSDSGREDNGKGDSKNMSMPMASQQSRLVLHDRNMYYDSDEDLESGPRSILPRFLSRVVRAPLQKLVPKEVFEKSGSGHNVELIDRAIATKPTLHATKGKKKFFTKMAKRASSMRLLFQKVTMKASKPIARSGSFSNFENQCLREKNDAAKPSSQRRQSFPSLDNTDWKKTANKRGML